jgi:hypothetical protein
MNVIGQPPRTPTTISIPCPWCDATVAVDDAFRTPVIRCAACATSIDVAPTTASHDRSIAVAA